MTKEKLKQEAEKYFKSICGDYNEEYERTGKRHYWVGCDIKNAYLAGAEPREKRIEELEHQLIHRNCLDCSNHSSKLRMRNLELEKENAKLKCECRTCVYTDSPCVRSDYPSKDGVCSHYKNVFEENVELKQENKVLAQNLEDTEILNKAYEKRFSDLEKKNAELKTRIEKQNSDILILKGLTERQRDQLTNAKEIISEYINILKGDTKNWKKTQEKAEQFLKECEVEK